MSERFYVREHSGFGIDPEARATAGNTAPGVEYMVIDREYCHRVVRSFAPRVGSPRGNRKKWLYRRTREAMAHALCAELNAQEREQS